MTEREELRPTGIPNGSPDDTMPGRRFSFLTTIRDDVLDSDFELEEDSEKADEDTERLIAWLDGELSEEESARLLQDLATSPALQNQLRQFRRTTDLVERLAPETPNRRAAASTMEMVAVMASDDLAARLHRERIHTILFTLVILVLFVGALGLGFGAARLWWWPQPTGRVSDAGRRSSVPVPERHEKQVVNQNFFLPPFEPDSAPANRFDRARDLLPEELRNENVSVFQTSFDDFLAQRMANDNGSDPGRTRGNADKEAGSPRRGKNMSFRPRGFQMIEQYLNEHSPDEFISRLSPEAQQFMTGLSRKEQCRYLGLLFSIDLLSREPGRRQGDFPDNEFRHQQGRNSNSIPPGMTLARPESDDAGFFWKTESTSDLASTLRSLPADRQAELLRLPSDEMYARLLVIHWGFDPARGPVPFERPGGMRGPEPGLDEDGYAPAKPDSSPSPSEKR